MPFNVTFAYFFNLPFSHYIRQLIILDCSTCHLKTDVPESGIRLALGSSRVDIVLLILREMAALLLVGLGIGTVVSLAAAQGAGAPLFGLAPHDATTLLASAGLLTAVVGLASFLPALRASRVDQMVALRHD